ncbi:hypothetical protein GVAV_002217 [Gurleya vavrai]
MSKLMIFMFSIILAARNKSDRIEIGEEAIKANFGKNTSQKEKSNNQLTSFEKSKEKKVFECESNKFKTFSSNKNDESSHKKNLDKTNPEIKRSESIKINYPRDFNHYRT